MKFKSSSQRKAVMAKLQMNPNKQDTLFVKRNEGYKQKEFKAGDRVEYQPGLKGTIIEVRPNEVLIASDRGAKVGVPMKNLRKTK